MSGYSRWEDAMVAQARLLEFTTSVRGRSYLRDFEGAIEAKHAPEERIQQPGFVSAIQRVTLSEADPIYASADITEVIDAARESFEPEPVRPTDPFTPFGFVLFPRALTLPDSDQWGADAVMPVRAMGWMSVIDETDPERGAFWISFYTHVDDDVTYGAAGHKISTEDAAEMRRALAPLTLSHTFQWSFGASPWLDEKVIYKRDTGSVESARLRGYEQVRLAQVVWRIGQQFVRGQKRVPRQMWKDARRKGLRKTDVTVITLRRSREGVEVEHDTGRQLTVRHIVRGHWHTYHTKQGARQLWIAPFVRGADHLPFRATKRVFEFVR